MQSCGESKTWCLPLPVAPRQRVSAVACLGSDACSVTRRVPGLALLTDPCGRKACGAVSISPIATRSIQKVAVNGHGLRPSAPRRSLVGQQMITVLCMDGQRATIDD